LDAVQQAPNQNCQYEILQGKKESGFVAGWAALHKWFTSAKVAKNISKKVDKALIAASCSSKQIIVLDADMPKMIFPNINKCDLAKEYIIIMVFGQQAILQ